MVGSVLFVHLCFFISINAAAIISGNKAINELPNELLFVNKLLDTIDKPKVNKTIEVLFTNVLPVEGNSIELVWRFLPFKQKIKSPQYAVYYGTNWDDFSNGPKIITNKSYVVIENLKFCSEYILAIIELNSGQITDLFRVKTYSDRREPPNFSLEFLPGPKPGVGVQISPSCPNIGKAMGYKIFIREPPHLERTVMIPKSIFLPVVQTISAFYDSVLEIKVSTDELDARFTQPIQYKIPSFLQPFDLEASSNKNRAFLVYWKEPFVPVEYQDYKYDVFIFAANNTQQWIVVVRTNRPEIVYQGDEHEYYFGVQFVNVRRNIRSKMSDLLYVHD